MVDYRTVNLRPEEDEALRAAEDHLESEMGVDLTRGEAVKLACQRLLAGTPSETEIEA